MTNPITTYDLTPVPASSSTLLTTFPGLPQHPTALATRINAYTLSNLTPQTYNHSQRAYHYGLAIKYHRFQEWEFSDETYFCACMLHNIGAMERNLTSTRLSFKFAAGILALGVLQSVNSGTELDGGGVDVDGNIDIEERVGKERRLINSEPPLL